MIFLFLLYFLFASTYALGKAGLFYMQPFFFVAARMLLGGTILLVWQYIFNRTQWRLEKRDIISLAAIALFLIYIAFIAEFWSLQYISAAKACLLYNMSPFITALFSYLIFKTHLSRKQWIGLWIGFLGFIPILLNQGQLEGLTYHMFFLSMPECMLLIAVASSCYGWLIMRYLLIDRLYSPIMVNGCAMLLGGFMALATSFLIEGKPKITLNLMPAFWSPMQYSLMLSIVYVVVLVVIANVICFNLYSVLLHRYTPTFIAFAGFTTPIFAAFFDLIFFKTPIPVAFYLTLLIVLIGMYLFYQDELKVL